jgi:hypothetical protein
MLDAVEKLLVLQDRDRKIIYLRSELAGLGPQRGVIQGKATRAQAMGDSTRQTLRHLEAERKKLELEVEAQKQQIERYSLQQFQTKKNEEYRALAHEIETARQAIIKLEDQELEVMEQAERAQKEAVAAARAAEQAKATAEKELSDLEARETSLKTELEKLEADRDRLAGAVDLEILRRYERSRRSKGDRVVVGVEHGVCGGCHMRLPAQILVTCQGDQEIVSCPNCGRILYYTRDMSLAVAE